MGRRRDQPKKAFLPFSPPLIVRKSKSFSLFPVPCRSSGLLFCYGSCGQLFFTGRRPCSCCVAPPFPSVPKKKPSSEALLLFTLFPPFFPAKDPQNFTAPGGGKGRNERAGESCSAKEGDSAMLVRKRETFRCWNPSLAKSWSAGRQLFFCSFDSPFLCWLTRQEDGGGGGKDGRVGRTD